MTLANQLVILRILSIPVVVLILALAQNPTGRLISAILFLIICLTDWLDGWLARKTQTVTDFGKLFDPLADKLLVTALLIVFLGLGEIDFWPVLIIIFREILVEGLRSWEMVKGKVVAASFWGKAKTVFQMLAVFWLILRWPAAAEFLWLAVLLTVISGVDYFLKLSK